MWFDDWQSLEQIAVKAIVGFAALVILLRIGGKRSVARLNAFDLVLVFTVGSILATTILNTRTTVSEGVLALVMLVGLEWLVAFFAARSARFRALIKSEPTLLVYDGTFQRRAMRRERIAEVEVLAALRQHGVHDVADVRAAVLETEGEISILRRDGGDPAASLEISGIDLPGEAR